MKLSVIILFVVASVALAQQQQQRQQVAVVTGSIVDMKTVSISGEQDPHQLAKLRTENNQTTIVDLGTKQQLQDVNIKPNQNIAVLGVMGKINGNPLLVAERVKFQNTGLQLVIDRGQTQNQQVEAQQASAQEAPAQEGSAQQASATMQPEPGPPSTQRQSVHGRVRTIRESSVHGVDHQIVELDTPGGLMLIDAGPVEGQHRYREGEQIAVSGQIRIVNDQGMLVADRISPQE